jgi:hypothetical protein
MRRRSLFGISLLLAWGMVCGIVVTTTVSLIDDAATVEAVTQKSAVSFGGDYGNCAVTDLGEMWCWGPTWDGMLANGTGGGFSWESPPATVPVQATVSGAISGSGSCAITTGNNVRCWGSVGRIEDGAGSRFSNPPWGSNVPTSYGFGAAEQVEGRCARLVNGTVQCYGWNTFGFLGDGSPSWPSSGFAVPPAGAPTATTVSGLTDVVDIDWSMNYAWHGCAVTSAGEVWCWGGNYQGSLGDVSAGQDSWPCAQGTCRDVRHSLNPVRVPGIDDAIAVDDHCARRAGGEVSCWGQNSGGRFDTSAATSTVFAPTEIDAFAGAVDVAVGANSACAVFVDGTVYCQGSFAIGDGSDAFTARSATLGAFGPDTGKLAAEIDTAATGMCARTRTGEIACWGGSERDSGIGAPADSFARVLAPTFVIGFGGGSPAPEVTAEITFEHVDPEDISDTFAFGEEFLVTLRVEVGDGDDGLELDIPGGDELFGSVDQVDVVEAPIPADGRIDEFAPMQFREYTWRVEAVDAGAFTVDGTITGLDVLGNPITPVDVSGDSKIEVLKVTITADPNEKNLTTEDLPEPVNVTVRVENISTTDVDNVTLQGWLDWSPLHPDEILPDVNLEFVDPAAVEAAFGTGQVFELGTIEPGAANAKTYEYELQATGRAHAELQQLVTATQDGEQFNSLATSDIRLGGLLLEFSSRVVRPITGQLLPAGQAIQIDGTITNKADFAIEVGPPPPTVSGNAGAMSVVWNPTGDGPPPQAATAPGLRVLQPDESVDFRVRITTQWSDPRTFGTQPSGGTRATIDFTPWGRYPDPDATPEPGQPTPYIYFETERMFTDDDELHHVVSIDDSIEIPEFDALDFASGVFVGTTQGLGHAAVGVVTGIIDTPYAIYSTMRGIYEFIEKVWGSFTPEEHAAFKESVLFATYQFMLRSAELAKQTYDEVKPQLDEMLTNAFTEMANKWEVGDYVGATQTYSRYTGELIGSILIPIALAKLAKAPQAVAAAQRAQAAIQQAAIPILQAARDTRLVRSLYRNLTLLKSGLILTPDDAFRLYGITPDELAAFQRIANAKKYLITVRSRHVSSAKWIDELKAMVKPEALKIKSVNDLDIRLGYDSALIEGRQPLGALVFKKPEPLIRFDAGEAGDIGGMVRQFVESKGFTPDSAEYQKALDRTYLRMKEWRKFESQYKKADREGLEVTYNYEGNQIPSDVRVAETKYLGFDLQQVPGEPETYVVRLMDDQGFFRPVTGDIDAIAFTKADGSPLTAREHADLLDEINADPLLQGQHGETATFDPPGSGLGGVDIIESQFKPNEPALQIMPDTEGARVVRFNKDKSRWADARDFNLHWDGGYVEMGRSLLTGTARPFQVTVPALVIADATKAFVLEASLDSDPNVGRCRVVESDTAEGAVSVFGGDGGLFEVLENGSVKESPLQEQCFGEGPPIDVVFRSASTIFRLIGSIFGRTPPSDAVGQANVTPTGVRAIELADPAGFDVGDTVLVGAGTTSAELRVVVDTSPLTFDRPLTENHAVGAVVVVVSPGAAGALHPLVPARVFETRADEVTVDGRFEGVGRLAAGSVTRMQMGGRGGVSPDAAAVAVNVTAIRPGAVGFVTLFPCDEEQPVTSSLNHRAGGVAGNSGIVKLNDDGELCVFTFADTDLVVDVNAWLAQAPSFSSLTPARLVETRPGEVTVDGEEQELGRLAAGSVTEVQIAGRGGVDADADAVALNVTAIRPAGVGFVTLYPCDEDRPTTSSLNYAGGGAVGNSAVVSLSAEGTLCVFTRAETDVVIDVNAWLADDELFDPFVPARFFETRSGEVTVDGRSQGVGRLDAMSVTPIQIAGRDGVAADASAVALNVTAIRPDGPGFVTLFPCDEDQPTTSSLNYAGGGAVGNSGVVKLGDDGTVCVFTRAATDLVIDVNAAWA